MKRMLFNATQPEELRVAIVDGQKLIDLDIESALRNEKKGNIYKAVVTKIEPSLEAAFVDYGVEKQGFLPLKEIYREYFNKYDGKTPISSIRIEQAIHEGQELVVQVDKDERGTKGASLTTFVSLAGRFLVLMPNNPKSGGISRRVSGENRTELRNVINSLNIADEHALIARTAGIGRSREELQWDLDYLEKLWQIIKEASTEHKAPYLIYQETNIVVRSIRDHLREDIDEILVDDSEIYERAKHFMQQVMPTKLGKLKLYQDNIPLFSRFQVENQIEAAFNRTVHLSSGGSITIDHTEALVSVDVNSARATRGADIEETALQTNIEAVDEVARQLRVRDMGGLIVIDLIDMLHSRNQRTVENRLKTALRPDRARVQVGQISQFGLLEMSRQRLRSSINEANYLVCPRCEGTGSIRSVVSSSLNLLRLFEEDALKENTEAIQASLPLDISTYLLNEKRHELNQLEIRLGTRIIILPSSELENPHFQIKRLKSDELDEIGNMPSHKLTPKVREHTSPILINSKPLTTETAKIQPEHVDYSSPPPSKHDPDELESSQTTSLLKRIWKVLSATDNKPSAKKPEQPAKVHKKKTTHRNHRNSSAGTRKGPQRQSSFDSENTENRRHGSKKKTHVVRRSKKKTSSIKRTNTAKVARPASDKSPHNMRQDGNVPPITRKKVASKKKGRRPHPNRKILANNNQPPVSDDIGNH